MNIVDHPYAVACAIMAACWLMGALVTREFYRRRLAKWQGRCALLRDCMRLLDRPRTPTKAPWVQR